MRKSKKLLNSIIDSISDGATVTGVCQKFGIARKTFYRWKEEDADFAGALQNAEGMRENLKNDIAEREHMKLINQGDWRAIKYQLEKKSFAEMKLAAEEFRTKIREIMKTERTDSIRKFHENFYAELASGEGRINELIKEEGKNWLRKCIKKGLEEKRRKRTKKTKMRKISFTLPTCLASIKV